MKFGGSSVATTDKIKDVARLIAKKRDMGHGVVVVVSAMGKTTNGLIELANQLTAEPSPREMDLLLSTGEMVSVSLLAMCLQEMGYKAMSMTGFQAGMRTSAQHMKARIDRVEKERLENAVRNGYIVCVAGFQGMDENGDITTLGRGGSDTSAVALAAALDGSCEIYTDVKGIYTVDPRVRPSARKLDRLSYQETMEMANLGAKVIEPRSVELAWKYNVPLYIALNTGDVPGTRILGEEYLVEKNTITNISKVDGVLLVSMKGNNGNGKKVTECFLKLAQANANLDIISHSIDAQGVGITSFTGLSSDQHAIERILEEMGMEYRFTENVSKVSIIGNAMRNQVGVAAKAFEVFVNQEVTFYEVSTSEISISYVVDTQDAIKIVNALADEFGL